VDNDRIFAAYAVLLVAGVASVITTSVITGVAALPSAGVFLEHVAMSFGFRAAYKSLDGFDWVYDSALFLGLITPADALPVPPSTGAEVMG
jgi:hypothetical protein